MNRLNDEWFSSKSESVPLWHKIALVDERHLKPATIDSIHSCFFRRVVQDDRKRVLDCVILSLKYGEQPISELVNQEKVDIGNIKVDIEI